VSREFSEEFGGRHIAEASQAGAVVVGDKGVEIGVAFGMVAKAAMGPQLWSTVEMLAEAAIEALDHAVGLRVKGADQAMGNPTLGADAIEGVLAGRLVVRLGRFVDGKAVGELGTVVGQHGMDGEREAVEKVLEKAGGGGGAAIGQDFEIDKAGGAVDGDIGVAAAAVERRQGFDVDVDEAGRRRGVKGGGRGRFLGKAGGNAVPLQTAVNGAARQLGVDASPHRLDDVVERQRQAAAQFDDQGFFPFSHRGGQAMRPGGSIDDLLAALPSRHGARMNPKLTGQRAVRGGTYLDVGADARRGRGIGVQLEIHHPVLPPIGRLPQRDRVVGTLAPVGPQAPPTRRAARLAAVAARARGSLLWTTGTSCASSGRNCRLSHSIACHNRGPSRQSSETKHLRGGRILWMPAAACCSSLLIAPKRIAGRLTASQIAAASAGSFLFRRTSALAHGSGRWPA